MPRAHNRIIALAALPFLVAAALTTAGSATSDTFLRTEPYELITGYDRNPWCAKGDDASVSEAPADLRGPHFSFSLSCLQETPAIPRDLAAAIPELEHVPPAREGVEFIVAQAARQSGYLPEYETVPRHLAS